MNLNLWTAPSLPCGSRCLRSTFHPSGTKFSPLFGVRHNMDNPSTWCRGNDRPGWLSVSDRQSIDVRGDQVLSAVSDPSASMALTR